MLPGKLLRENANTHTHTYILKKNKKRLWLHELQSTLRSGRRTETWQYSAMGTTRGTGQETSPKSQYLKAVLPRLTWRNSPSAGLWPLSPTITSLAVSKEVTLYSWSIQDRGCRWCEVSLVGWSPNRKEIPWEEALRQAWRLFEVQYMENTDTVCRMWAARVMGGTDTWIVTVRAREEFLKRRKSSGAVVAHTPLIPALRGRLIEISISEHRMNISSVNDEDIIQIQVCDSSESATEVTLSFVLQPGTLRNKGGAHSTGGGDRRVGKGHY